jgi:hypothetical protein
MAVLPLAPKSREERVVASREGREATRRGIRTTREAAKIAKKNARGAA